MPFKSKVSTLEKSVGSVYQDSLGKNQLDKKSGAGVSAKKKMTRSTTKKSGLGPMSQRQYRSAMAASRR